MRQEVPDIRVSATWIAGGVVALLVFFRGFFLSGFQTVLGEPFDGALMISYLEHWFEVFGGHAHWRSPLMFHPHPGTLGYSDTFFLYGLPYSLFRCIGADMLRAYQLTLMSIGVVGFAGMGVLLRKRLRLSTGVSVIGSLLFALSNPVFLSAHGSHVQMFGVWLLPLPVLFFLGAVERRKGPAGPYIRSATACAGSFALIAFSTFYVAWFLGLFVLIAGVVGLVLRPVWIASAATHMRRFWPRHLLVLLLVVVVFIPFFVTYLPVQQEKSGYPYEWVRRMTLAPLDYVNVGSDNLIWGGLVGPFSEERRLEAYERRYGIPPFLLLLFLGTIAAAVAGRGEFWRERRIFDLTNRSCVLLLGATTLIAWLLCLDLGRHHSLWKLVYEFIPGGSAVRYVARLNLFLHMIVLVVAMIGLSACLRLRVALLLPLVVLLPAEQINFRDTSRFHVADVRFFFDSIDPAPADLKAFHVEGNPGHDRIYPWYQVRAMLVAHRLRVPTLNGHSGQHPPGWNLGAPDSDLYRTHVFAWRKKHGLEEGLYALNLDTGRWTRSTCADFPERAYDPGSEIVRPENHARYFIDGWSHMESWGIWTTGSTALLSVPLPPGEWRVKADLTAFRGARNGVLQVDVFSGDRKIDVWIFDPDEPAFPIALDVTTNGDLDLRLVIDQPRSPRSTGMSADSRLLGLGLKSMTIVRR